MKTDKDRAIRHYQIEKELRMVIYYLVALICLLFAAFVVNILITPEHQDIPSGSIVIPPGDQEDIFIIPGEPTIEEPTEIPTYS